MEPVICEAFPDKKRYGRYNQERARKDARRYQVKYRKNLRVYECESCKGYHLTSESRTNYLSRTNQKPNNSEQLSNV